nr:pentatricopeptide repeat-containing protein At5g39350-like [Solanum lycopersicum]
MQVRTVVTWNTMISGYCRNDSPKEALMIYRRMEDAGVHADCATVLSVLPACGCLKNFEMGREVHSLVEQVGFRDNLSVWKAVVDMYVKYGRMDKARSVFEKMIDRDVVTWTTMIHGFISIGT